MLPDTLSHVLGDLLARPFTITLLGAVINHDYETHRHLLNVGTLAARVAVCAGLAHDEALAVAQAGLFHDVGKLHIDPNLLRAARPLGEKEWDAIRCHPAGGETILQAYSAHDLARIVRSHHERLDGSGYPDGLRGLKIPSQTRLLSVVDAYDAMRAGRPYAMPVPHDEALERLVEARTLYDTDAVVALIGALGSREAVAPIS